MYIRKGDPVLKELFRQGSPRLSTAEEYRIATISPEVDNSASKFIEEGFEPMLISEDATEMGVHPFITVIDVGETRRGGKVSLSLSRTSIDVPSDTILRWN